MKVSVSLPEDDVEFLDTYANAQGLGSRPQLCTRPLDCCGPPSSPPPTRMHGNPGPPPAMLRHGKLPRPTAWRPECLV